ncbi:MAG: hypothetical protein CMJ32_00400 [Phycisphaerae bacterium]|nr:hypothetical protein [Phycisphaerae bacterium]
MTQSELKDAMDRYGPGLMALATGICRDRHLAEEMVEEAFVRLWKSGPDAGPIAHGSWLRRVVTNLSINATRRKKLVQSVPDTIIQTYSGQGRTAEQVTQQRFELERVREAMDRLDPAKRALLMLRGSENLSYDAIAEHLGIPRGTVMSRLNRARLCLQEELKRSDPDQQGDDHSWQIKSYHQA